MNKSPTILLVDDDPRWLDTLSNRLARLGYKVSTAQSAHEAQQLAAIEHPAMILVDRGLPGDGAFGRQVLRQLRDASSVAGIPVLMTSARHRHASFPS